MNITPFHGTPFTPSKEESFWSSRTLGCWLLNIVTLGIFEAIRSFSMEAEFNNLTLENKEITDQAKNKFEKWNQLEPRIKKVFAQLSSVNTDQNAQTLEKELNALVSEKDQLSLVPKKKSVLPPLKPTFSAVARDLISFIGRLLLDVPLTLGLYGVARNHVLQNRVKKLKECKEFVKDQSQKFTQEKTKESQDLIQTSQKMLSVVKENIAIKNTDAGKAYLQVQSAKQEIKDLDQQLQTKSVEISSQSGQINQLKKQVQDLSKKTYASASGLGKFASEIGPVAPKYTPEPGDGEINGAMDGVAAFPASLHVYVNDYNAVYGDKYSASEVITETFNNSFVHLQKSPYQLNKSYETPTTPGAFAVYRLMVLGILSMAKVTQEGCQGYVVKINDNVTMLPSKPEKILHYKKESDGSLKPVVVFHYQQKDDFTPSEEVLGMNGVDPVSVAWIWKKLNNQERKYLEVYLYAPVMENDHPDYKAMLAFMSKKNDPRVKLVKTAADLIEDMAIAIEKKFGKNVLIPCWQNHANDFLVKPFIKQDDQVILNISNTTFTDPVPEKIVKWEIDKSVIGSNPGIKPDLQFQQLMENAKNHHQQLADSIEIGNCLVKPEKVGKSFAKMNWDTVNEHFHHCHQMIGSNAAGEGGTVKCLYSNLLAILLKNKNDLTEDNARKLKCSMAAYLDKLKEAKKDWDSKKSSVSTPLSEEMQMLKRKAEMMDMFKEECSLHYDKCSIEFYQSWLRNQVKGLPYINFDELTPFEILLAAHTLGVRICLLQIDELCPTKADKLGRIIPVGQVYGPNTKEILFMAIKNNTYYGLQPKLQVSSELFDTCDQIKINAVLNHENYWTKIKLNKS